MALVNRRWLDVASLPGDASSTSMCRSSSASMPRNPPVRLATSNHLLPTSRFSL
ncbi:MAG: hypothetical protein OQL19_18555 [Gammaproteobacteria bacterium]|nr:hypothetical protein [Gammaproteobacteria bacterium]